MTEAFEPADHREELLNRAKPVLRLALYRGNTFVKEYRGEGQKQIAADIAKEFGVQVNPSALWRTMKWWSGNRTAAGFSLREIDGQLQPPLVETSLLRAMCQKKAALLTHADGRRYLVWSYQHKDCTALGYNGGNMGCHLRRCGYPQGSNGWRGRFLTAGECGQLISHSPCFYEVSVNGEILRGWNLSQLALERGFAEPKGTPPPHVWRIVHKGAGHCIAYGRHISGRIVYTGLPMAMELTAELCEMLDGGSM